MPISAGEILSIAKFAYKLWESCKAAPSDFQQIGKEVFAMRTVLELVQIECEDPDATINLLDKKRPERLLRKRLGIYIRHYGKRDRAVWALRGKSEVTLLEANLSTFASQLDSYMEKITSQGVGLVNANMMSGIGRLEDLLENYLGNEKAAVAEMMRQRQRSGVSTKGLRRSRKVFEDYAQEMSQFSTHRDDGPEGTIRPTTPDPPRNHKYRNGNGHLGPPSPERGRRKSVGAVENAKRPMHNRHRSSNGRKPRKPDYILECWLIQIKSAQALFVTFEMSEKESQCRGQWKLREMAKQYNGCSEKDKLAGDHDLVKWVLKDRNKKEEDERY
ncbi:MAG: hypothetical protein Q9191_008333, partial [Dirinaria sp. TL-2023a]